MADLNSGEPTRPGKEVKMSQNIGAMLHISATTTQIYVGRAGNCNFGENHGSIIQSSETSPKPSGSSGVDNVMTNKGESAFLEKLLAILGDHVASGAGHNPMEPTGPILQCAEGTRESVINEIWEWFSDPEAWKRRILWLHGAVYSGKSVIAHTMVAGCQQTNDLAARFFFSSTASQGNRSTRHVISDIAYQIFRQFERVPELQCVAERAWKGIKRDPSILNHDDVKTQLEVLIIKPLRESKLDERQLARIPGLIIFDGVDQICDGQSPQQDVKKQNELLSALLWATRDPYFPFRLLIVSRPNNNIRDTLGKALGKGAHKMIREIDLKDHRFKEDIRKYLDSEFQKIREIHYPGTKFQKPWPKEEELDKLVAKSCGYFAYPAAVVQYVGYNGTDGAAPGDAANSPEARLDWVLSRQPRDGTTLGGPGGASNPFVHLHMLYANIIKRCLSGEVSDKVQWLRAISMCLSLPAWFWREYLPLNSAGGADAQVRQVEQGLESLITIPPVESEDEPYTFPHESLKEFLHDRLASSVLGPDADVAHFPHFQQKCFIQALTRRGASKTEAKNGALFDARDRSFVSHFISAMEILQPPLGAILSPELDLASCDLYWWTTQLITSNQCEPSTVNRLFQFIHSSCPWYSCTKACRHWRRGIIEACASHGWRTPNMWVLLRNRFTRYVTVDGVRLGYPPDSQFCPPGKEEGRRSLLFDNVSFSQHPAPAQRALYGHLSSTIVCSMSIPAILWLTSINGLVPVSVRNSHPGRINEWCSRGLGMAIPRAVISGAP